ncbi:hypothetical protein BB559_000166 [Furculomyces boomerangus]|uniref:Glutamine-dependent NAD(+) synthetase n=2 Tax=Harpellales TaxID=61421 RepID=A0A2T9Z673_9FUNG|nr:hypothetical protein BB559_000166 [Furculomyces boomerangus]PWA03735.1 hypothetical protein BB558_000093 [Smittium angustum]
MNNLVTVATCSLNQWALDFLGNYNRIRQSIIESKKKNAVIRVGSELEIPGYSCQDHFHEGDTVTHSWEVLAKILADKELYGILIITGMPVIYKSHRYNCSIAVLNGRIELIRPKMWMASDGNYRELRWFTPWLGTGKQNETMRLPKNIIEINGQKDAPIGFSLLEFNDGVVGFEICEELFVPKSPHIDMCLDGADIIINSSGSHHELRKLAVRIDLMREATRCSGGVYLYSNQRGCDGDRLYFDGASMVLCNGEVLSIGTQFSLNEIEIVVATVDLENVKSYRASLPSLGAQSSLSKSLNRVIIDFDLRVSNLLPTEPVVVKQLSPEEEINFGPACWLWDYLRRSRQGGFFLALSGGIDSCTVALIAYSMCNMVTKAAKSGNKQVISDLHAILGLPSDSTYIPTDAKELTNKLVHTCYMGTENSSQETRTRASEMAKSIGTYHIEMNFDSVVAAILAIFVAITSKTPRFSVHGGTNSENLALQNIQARLRLVLSYLFASLLLWVRDRPRSLLVLGASNVDECLRGYMTKYDCSSADLNPIGSISKNDLRGYINFAKSYYDLNILGSFLDATPTAELIPITSQSAAQSDEVEMGMTYDELSTFGKLRKIEKCGPYSMFVKLTSMWNGYYHPAEIANKVKTFFYYYAINRHKMTTLTPSYHAEAYSPDDNRYDHRPFLYESGFVWQFQRIDNDVELLTSELKL